MKIFKWVVLGLLTCPLQLVWAQKVKMDDYDWHKGVVIIEDAHIPGKVAYDDRYEVVYLNPENSEEIKTLPTHQLDTVKIYNTNTRVTHVYANYPIVNRYGYEVQVMYEEIITGPVTYLKKGTFESIEQYNGNIGITGNSSTIDLVRYYLYYDGHIEAIKKFEKQTLAIYDITRKELRKVLNRYRIEMKSPRGQARCIYHLNEMVLEKELALSFNAN
ncbi:MAG: hypothetical protein RIF33_17045 [Cyclobacteriaceae bacterium]